MQRDIPITLTFMSRWWEQHFYSSFERPAAASDDELERVSLQRQRFLFEHFGDFGIGEEHPVNDGKHVNVIMKWCVDFIPYLLGVKLRCQEEGFWSAEPLTHEEIRELKPVDIASLPFVEWILKRKETLIKRYGKAETGQLVEGSINAALRIRGNELYCDLMTEKGFVRDLLDVITQTVIQTYRFFAREFELREIFLANCTNAHIGPELYEEIALQNDIRIAEETRSLFDKDRYVYVHNCDSKADKFIGLYSRVSGLAKLDGSDNSDVELAKMTVKDIHFVAFVNPTALQQTPAQLHERINAVLRNGADELLIANIDSVTEVSRVRQLLTVITDCCREMRINPVLSVIPFTEDEYDWSFPRYQGKRINHCTDDWRLLVPKGEADVT